MSDSTEPSTDPDSRPGRTSSAGPGAGKGLAAHAPFADAGAAADAMLSRLRGEVGFGWWAVTRITGGTYAILSTGRAGFPLRAGEQLAWADSLCRAVAEGQAPRIVPDVRAVPALRDAPLAGRWGVGAYLSSPLTLDGESLFGTLCALDREPLPAEAASRMPLVDLQARLLSTALAADLRLDEARRRAERAEADALMDPLTGLVNRRGWDMLLDREEQRCRRYGAVASVLVIDLDGLKTVNDRRGHAAGDAVLQRTAAVLRDAFRGTDVVARVGGDEFAVLAVETDAEGAVRERDRLHGLLDDAGVPASIGAAVRDRATGLEGAWASADADMYAAKRDRGRRQGR